MYAYSDGRGHAQASTLRKLGVKIRAYVTDNIVSKEAAGIPEACVDGLCVGYLKSCTRDGLICEFEWGRFSSLGPTKTGRRVLTTLEFSISARSVEIMQRTEEALFVEAAREGGNATLIPVSAMHTESEPLDPATCRNSDPLPDCIHTVNALIPPAIVDREERIVLPPTSPVRTP